MAKSKSIAGDFFRTPEEVRLLWPALLTPNTTGFDGKTLDKPRYEVAIFIPKLGPTAEHDRAWQDYARKITEVMMAHLGHANWDNVRTGNKPWPLRDSDEPLFLNNNPWAVNTWHIRCRSLYPPRVVDAQNNEITLEMARRMATPPIKSGDYGLVSLNFWTYEYQGNFGISAGLEGVKFTRSGDPAGGGARSAADIFGAPTGEPVYGGPSAVEAPPNVPPAVPGWTPPPPPPGPVAPAGYGMPLSPPPVAGGYGPPNGGLPPPPPAAAPPPPPPPTPVDPRASWQRSPDGQWILNPTTNQWERPPAVPPQPAYVPIQPPSSGPVMPPGYGPSRK